MRLTRCKKNPAAAAVLAFGILLAASAFADVQIPKADYYGTWAMNHDGWQGKLVLKASGIADELRGEYRGADGMVRSVTGKVDSQKVSLSIDLQGTSGKADDQVFEGCLFTQSRAAMAGTTRFGGVIYGWYAVKESGETVMPPLPVVSTDHPDPSGPEEDPVIVSGGGEVRLSMPKEEWRSGEPVVFRFSSTRTQTVDLSGCYYLIEKKEVGLGVEFFTSKVNPFPDLKLSQGEARTWRWEQRDNEETHKAQPGAWRIRFFAPGVREKPFTVVFRIIPSGD
ncbi:MAG: hypothetical protein JW843_08955 [Candidatus Aminicenantes bacterium]|nr:hypothetical protein [Candidatus Aminicenantes bacterium]